ncbi:SAM hydrolase/SAM-dependent halogenase family protein [Dactylosporangium sp. CA-139066]|uniref:SAM hydrolase/SAM-dependent halogenase family protein n=1 Tax=Dactylosporangium sp. CA-139066 TaxID=3239930 RepID=UPI003D937104
MTPSTISFTTDYGLSDGFVAACHGTIARLAPQARIIDVTHLIPPGDIRRAAAVLAQTAPSLPPPSVHLAVVDPGVGTERRPIALATHNGFLVGPDNGLLIPAAESLGGITTAVHLTNEEWFAPTVSATFHGRDIFAPVAARLATGASLLAAGDPIDDVVRLPPPYVEQTPGRLIAEVLTIDHFGNVQLAATPDLLPPDALALTVESVAAARTTTFGDAPPGALVLLTDSAGYLAIAVNGGSAAALLSLTPGDRVTITY